MAGLTMGGSLAAQLGTGALAAAAGHAAGNLVSGNETTAGGLALSAAGGAAGVAAGKVVEAGANALGKVVTAASDKVTQAAGSAKEINNNVRAETKALPQLSTGRTTPNNLKEKLAMEQAMSDPLAGKNLNVPLDDPKNGFYSKDGWQKMAQNINGVEIHYNLNTKNNSVADFKFKGE